MTEFTNKREISIREIVHLFRYWMAMKNVPESDKIRIEIHFPSQRSQHYAMSAFMQEFDHLTTLSTHRVGPIGPERVQIEGVTVIFSNPERLDKRP